MESRCPRLGGRWRYGECISLLESGEADIGAAAAEKDRKVQVSFGSRNLSEEEPVASVAPVASVDPAEDTEGTLPAPEPGTEKPGVTHSWQISTTRFMYERRSLRWWEMWDVGLLFIVPTLVIGLPFILAVHHIGKELRWW
jgi:hypothetical protein